MAKTDDTLRMFVLRARRIAAHSLAGDREGLAGLANPSMSASLSVDGTVEFRRQLPDEEIFESLAARLRPVLLARETVHYAKVLRAIESVLSRLGDDLDGRSEFQQRLDRLREGWSRHAEDKPRVLRYAVQQAKVDGTESTPVVSDSQLALAWLYGDLVHVDVRGEKEDGALLPIKERYAAAVSYFSTVALLCADTYALITDLADQGLVSLGDQTMEVAVVVGTDGLVETATAFIAPEGTDMPAQFLSSPEVPEGFEKLTVTTLKRLEERNQVQVRLEAADGSLVAEYGAAVIRRHAEGKRHEWQVLVAGCITYTLAFDVEDAGPSSAEVKVEAVKLSTNRMALDKAIYDQQQTRSEMIRFMVLGQEFFHLPVMRFDDADMAAIDVSVDSLEDLVAIERTTGRNLAVPTGSADVAQRADLRTMRLLWEGKAVPLTRGPVATTAESGVVPRVLVVPAGERQFAGTMYPTPHFLAWHPLMVAEDVSAVPGSNPPLDSMRMAVPLDEPFVAWAPDRSEVDGDRGHRALAPWDLSHFDSTPFLGEWTVERGLTTADDAAG